jgi:hydroxypyruvate isomerase
LRTATDAIAVIDRAGEENVSLLCDLYHLHSNGDDLDKVIDSYAGRIAHVQIADAPGRGEPGTGSLDLDRYLNRLELGGYDGWVSLEYKPSDGDTVRSLSWLTREEH